MDNKIDKVKKIITILKEEYPDAGPRLKFSNPLELLVAGILAAQCTDDKVNEVTETLFKKYRTANDYANVDLNDLMNEIYSTGTFRRKAEAIKECCKALVDKYKGNVPNTINDLVSLPGVGRKTANMVLADAFGIPSVIMDTHVIRLSQRIGLSDKKIPDKMEQDLLEIVPGKDKTIFSHLLAFHGRKICVAKKPKCEQCKINNFCDYYLT
ncbi:MAG: endonuclease III [Candidatus Poribacteria bacterium]